MLPDFDLVYPFYFWLLSVGIVSLCVLVAWLSCKKILRIHPAQALRPPQPESSGKIFFEKLPGWDKLKFNTRYNMRDVSRNKGRTVFGLAGTISCMAIMLCGFTARDNFQNAVTDIYAEKLLNNASIVTVSEGSDIEEAERIRDLTDGELIMSTTAELRIPGSPDKMSCHVNVYENGRVANILNEDLETEKLSGDGFSITRKTAEAMGIKDGDKVEWHIYGSSAWTLSTVTLISRAPFEQGIVTTRELIENAGYTFTPTRLLTQQDIGKDAKELSAAIEDITPKADLADLLNDYTELINMVMGFMLILAVILAVIVLFSLGLMSFEERQREMATLKVMGFGTKRIRRLMLRQNIILAVAGTVIGIPVGIGMLKLLLGSLGNSLDIPSSCGIQYVLLSFALTILISAVVNLLFTRRIAGMDMVAQTKGVE